MSNIQPIILAGGKGTRMNQGVASPIPKALYEIAGKPMILYILETLKKITNNQSTKTKQNPNYKFQSSNNLTIQQCNNITILQPIIVVGYKAQEVIKALDNNTVYLDVIASMSKQSKIDRHVGINLLAMTDTACKSCNKYQYAIQKQRLGTGHAAKIGLDKVSNSASDVFILQSDDSAFYKKETLERAIAEHKKNQATITLFTTRIPGLTDYGRIIRAAPATPVSHRAGLRGGRDEKGEIKDIVEKENMTAAQAKIDETNCGAYLVNTKWLKDNIGKITKHYKNGQEYPLPDIIKIALAQNKKVLGLQIDPSEWVGINSPDQLARANKMMGKIHPKSKIQNPK